MKSITLLIILLLQSCSIFQSSKDEVEDAIDFSQQLEYSELDYLEHLKSLKVSYLNSDNIQTIRLKNQSRNYLNQISSEIQKQNELFFSTNNQVNFTIVENEIPFHFSLPGKNIFISSGLINKYIKSEKLLYCLVAYELIRAEKGVYRKQTLVPTGFLTTEKVLSMMRLKIEDKVEVHKWAFYLLKRVGIDTDNYLSWLQIQNRNSVDFSKQLGDIRMISREEALFKAFIVKNTSSQSQRFHAGSSSRFYSFIKNIKR